MKKRISKERKKKGTNLILAENCMSESKTKNWSITVAEFGAMLVVLHYYGL